MDGVLELDQLAPVLLVLDQLLAEAVALEEPRERPVELHPGEHVPWPPADPQHESGPLLGLDQAGADLGLEEAPVESAVEPVVEAVAQVAGVRHRVAVGIELAPQLTDCPVMYR